MKLCQSFPLLDKTVLSSSLTESSLGDLFLENHSATGDTLQANVQHHHIDSC